VDVINRHEAETEAEDPLEGTVVVKSTQESITKAALLMIGASAFFVIMNSLAKSLADQIPYQEVAMFRSMSNLFFLLPIILYKKRTLLGNDKKTLFLRSVLGFSSLFLCFYSMSAGILAESTILIKTSILFSALFSAFFLKEKLRPNIVGFSLLGFIGAVIIINPRPDQLLSLPGLAALGSGILIGLIAVTLRKLQKTDDSLNIVFAFSLWGTVFGALASCTTFVTPDLYQSGILLLVGLSGLIAQFMFTESFKFGPASVIHPFMYSEIFFAVLIGKFIFQESLNFHSYIGAFFIITSGLLILRAHGAPFNDIKLRN
jgi:drug/metabolite transporter (DMT)-like permease